MRILETHIMAAIALMIIPSCQVGPVPDSGQCVLASRLTCSKRAAAGLAARMVSLAGSAISGLAVRGGVHR